jgi:phage gp36-like protein
MEDPKLDISIGADSSGAVSAFDSLENSVEKLDKNITNFGNKIQKPITQIGLSLYAQELSRSVGLSGAAGQAASVLSASLTRLGSSFQFLSGPSGLAIAGVIALSGAIYKAINYNKEHQEKLEDSIASQTKALESTDSLKDSIERYKEVVNKTTPELDALMIATDKYTTAQSKLLALDLQKQLADLRKELEGVHKAHQAEVEGTAASAATMDRWASGTKDAKAALDALNKATLKEEEDSARLKMRIAELEDMLARYAKTGRLVSSQRFYKEQADEAEEAARKEAEAQKKITDALRREDEYRRRLYRESLAFVKAIIDSRYNMEIAAYHGTGAQAAVAAKMVQDAYGNAYMTMTKGAGDAFAAMAVDGEKFNKSMDQVLKNVVKSFISAIVEMEIRWAASRFMRAVGLGIVPSAEMPMTRAAVGLNTVVSRPTLLLVGEGGEDEEVKVTPRSQAQISSGSGVSGGNVSVTVINHINGGGKIDTARLADQIGKQVISRIRGQGDLNFVRG